MLDVVITPTTTQTKLTGVDQLLCTTSVAPTTATYSWKDLVTDDVIGTDDRLDLAALCNATVQRVDSSASQETRFIQCTAAVHHELVGTVTASNNISFNISTHDYCNSTLGN